MPVSDPDAFEAAELDRLSAQERVTLAVLGALALAALGVLAWQRQRPALTIAGTSVPTVTAAPPQAGWDGALEAARQVDVNAASVAELERLPGVGPALARRIVEEREQHGPFYSAEDLGRVRGIGPKTYQALKAYVRIE